MDEKLRSQIRGMIDQGMRSNEIAAKLGVSPMQVAAIRAHMTMGTYTRDPMEVADEGEAETYASTFGLERDLQDALRENIEQLEPGLRIADKGKEVITSTGRPDITCEDREGNLVAVELKSGLAADEALTQVLGYMAALKREHGKSVRGILVAGDFSRRMAMAATNIPNLVLKRYRINFTFERAD